MRRHLQRTKRWAASPSAKGASFCLRLIVMLLFLFLHMSRSASAAQATTTTANAGGVSAAEQHATKASTATISSDNSSSNNKRQDPSQSQQNQIQQEQPGDPQKLSCETQADGSLLCQFLVAPADTVATAMKATVTYCSDDGGFCLDAKVRKNGSKAAVGAPAEGAEDTGTVDDNDGGDVSASPSADADVKISLNGTSLIVGDYVYNKPFDENYGKDIATVLRIYSEKLSLSSKALWLHALGVEHKREARNVVEMKMFEEATEDDDLDWDTYFGDDEDMDDDVDAKLIDEIMEMDDDESLYMLNYDKDDDVLEVKKALYYFGLSSKIHLDLISRHRPDGVGAASSSQGRKSPGPDTEAAADHVQYLDAAYRLARTYVQTSELYTFAEEYEVSLDDTDSKDPALNYMTKAESLYRSVVEGSGDPLGASFPHREEAEEQWSKTCVSAGDLILEQKVEAIDVEALEMKAGEDELYVNAMLKDPNAAGRIFGHRVKASLLGIAQADRYFDIAVRNYNEAIRKERDKERLEKLRLNLALTWNSKATAATMRGDPALTIKHGERAFTLYQTVLKAEKLDSEEQEDVTEKMANLSFIVAENYLKFGMWDVAASKFQQAMRLHRDYSLIPADACYKAGIWNGDADTDAYEKALDEYETNSKSSLDYEIPDEDGLADEIVEKEIHYYERDDEYEADLHAGLGSILLHEGDVLEAAAHLKAAVRLYETGEDVDDDEALADIKYNLAVVDCQMGKYKESGKLFREAVRLYRDSYGLEGINPLKRSPEAVAAASKVKNKESASLLPKWNKATITENKKAEDRLHVPSETEMKKVQEQAEAVEEDEKTVVPAPVLPRSDAESGQDEDGKKKLDLLEYWTEALSSDNETVSIDLLLEENNPPQQK